MISRRPQWEAALSFPTWGLSKAPPYGNTYQYRSGGGTEPWASTTQGLSSGMPGGGNVPVGMGELKILHDLPQSPPMSHPPPLNLDLAVLQSSRMGWGTRVGWGQVLTPLPTAWAAWAEPSKASRSIPKSSWFPKVLRNPKGLLSSGGKGDLMPS